MLPAERRQFILERIESDGSVRTIDLAQRLEVADETIRRDLDWLEQEGLISRTHGGAVPLRAFIRERSYDERKIENIEAKRRIAEEARTLIQSGETLYIDASSTAFELVRQIEDLELRIITHSLNIAELLGHQTAIELHLLGGRFDPESRSFLGPETLLALQRFRVDKVICSGNGIEPTLGVSEINQDQAILKETAALRATRFIFLADHTKLGLPSAYYFTNTSRIDHFVTDAPSTHPVVNELAQMGIQCHPS